MNLKRKIYNEEYKKLCFNKENEKKAKGFITQLWKKRRKRIKELEAEKLETEIKNLWEEIKKINKPFINAKEMLKDLKKLKDKRDKEKEKK